MIKHIYLVLFPLLLFYVGCQKDIQNTRLTGHHDVVSSTQYSTPYVQVLDGQTYAPIPRCSLTLNGWGHVVKTNDEGCFGSAIHSFPEELASRGRELFLWHSDYDCRCIRDYMPDPNGKVTVFMQKSGSASLLADASLVIPGQPAKVPRVRLLSVDKRTEVRRMERSKDWRYRFSGLKPGEYTIEVYFWDAYPTHCEPVVLQESETTTVQVCKQEENGTS